MTSELPDKEYSTSSIEYSKYGTPTKYDKTSTTKLMQPQSQSPPTYIEAEVANEPVNLRGLDLSKYRRPELVEAIDHLTSWPHAIKLLTFPALKIWWASLFVPSPLSFLRVFKQLSGVLSITSVAEPPAQKPSLISRIFRFIFVGFPLAILVGLIYGVLNVIYSYLMDVMKVIRVSATMFAEAKGDLQYFKDHPERRPTKDETTTLFLDQVIHPYSDALIKKKLGFLSFLSRPVTSVVNGVTGFVTRRAVNNLDYYGRHVQNFHAFRDGGVKHE